MTPSVPHTAPPASSLGEQVQGVGGEGARSELNPSSCLPLLAAIVFDRPAVPQLLLFLYPRKKPCEETTPKRRVSANTTCIAVFIVFPVSSKDQEARLDEQHPRALSYQEELRDQDVPPAGWSIVSNMIPGSHIPQQNGKNLILPHTDNHFCLIVSEMF